MNLISLSKELEAYEYYMDNIVTDINEEIDLAFDNASLDGLDTNEAW